MSSGIRADSVNKMAKLIEIKVNGSQQHVAQDIKVIELLDLLGDADKGVALAINQEIVSRSEWQTRCINSGDNISLFQAIAGG